MTATSVTPARSAGAESHNGSRPPRGPKRPRLSRRRRQLRLLIPIALIAAAVTVAFTLRGAQVHMHSVVSVYPISGSLVASPETQIAFRGISPRRLTHIVVRGSKSGSHGGRVQADADGRGGSFLPATPFAPGERVTVTTPLDIAGARGGSFHFTVAQPASALPNGGLAQAARVPGDVRQFNSRPDLSPAALEPARDQLRAPGVDLFLTPQEGPIQNGPMIVTPSGKLVWFQPLPKGELATDFRVQSYQHQPVLTWWQGQIRGGAGFGEGIVMNRSYQQVATVHGASGLRPDLHAFQLTSRGTALITAYFPVWWNASSVGGARRQVVLDSVVQEVELHTGLVRFQWDSLDHVPLRDSYASPPKSAGSAYDYFHVNSVDQAPGGRFVISARTTSALYEIDPRTGRVVWTLGGKRSSFHLGPGASFAFQHDGHFVPHHPTMLSLFDDGAGPPVVHKQSRAITIRLNYRHMTASLVRADKHSPSLLAYFEGNVQNLPDGDQVVGWGESPYVSEFDPSGRMIFDARFVGDNSTYRAFMFPWRGTPTTRPALTTSSDGHSETVYASWNGATEVVAWRVLGGNSANSLVPVAVASKQGFETGVQIVPTPYVAVQALSQSGRVLSTSKTVKSQ